MSISSKGTSFYATDFSIRQIPTTDKEGYLPIHRFSGYSGTRPRILKVVSDKKRRLSFKIILPTFIVVIGAAGMATFFFLWLHLHKIQDYSAIWREGAFELDEGTRHEGEREAARLVGLTIASAAAKIVVFTSPAVIGLYSFYLAQLWLDLDAPLQPNSRLPTPLQYGLLVSLLSDSSLRSLFSTARYLLRGDQRRASASTLLTHAFLMCGLIFIITNTIGVVDLWLHTVATTSVQIIPSMMSTPFKYGIDQVECKPYPEDWAHVWEPCLVSPGGWGNGVLSKAPGMLVRANNSDSLRTITLADANDMAILVKPDVPQNAFFRATSFGAHASCQSVNPLCDKLPVANCAGFPSDTFPPFDGYPTSPFAPQGGGSQLFIQSSNCAWDASCLHVSTDVSHFDRPPGQGSNPPVNAYNFWMQFLWTSEGDQAFGVGSGNSAVGSYLNYATMLVNCTLQFYNVTVDYRNESYSLVKKELSNVGLSDGLALPSRLGHFTSNLLSNVEGRAFTDNSSDAVMAFIEQDFARLALGSAAVITNVSRDTLFQGSTKDIIVGRYPLWPVTIFVLLMYTHASLALVLFLITTMPIRREAVALTKDDRSTEQSVSILELAQMRLRGPLPLVFSSFPPQHTDADEVALSIETDELDMFDERPSDQRVVAGLHTESGPPPRFGVYRSPLYLDHSTVESKLRAASGSIRDYD